MRLVQRAYLIDDCLNRVERVIVDEAGSVFRVGSGWSFLLNRSQRLVPLPGWHVRGPWWDGWWGDLWQNPAWSWCYMAQPRIRR